jgi:hypothetical protein
MQGDGRAPGGGGNTSRTGAAPDEAPCSGALDRWQVEGKRCSVGHDGCGARLIRDAIRLNTDLLRESLALRHGVWFLTEPIEVVHAING